ncbi:OPT super [Coemansia sp. RSA 1821]|nr:OPT oligopeptide transporter protein-domain-containing protein [Coemansia mojavensis]KAJ1741176.1 OPT super [Coemansia sp. RSA 1086]KAJ1751932.1 OPT super [Coemansia sp. RSA 1821]KAJ2670340.1 OPT super [Coemansia sp. RSA 1085]
MANSRTSSSASVSEYFQFASPKVDMQQGYLGGTFYQNDSGTWQVPVDEEPECQPDSIFTNSLDSFSPSIKAWVCALLFTAIEATVSPLFLFRAYSMPITPLLIPVFVYPLCRWSKLSNSTNASSLSISELNNDPSPTAVDMNELVFKNSRDSATMLPSLRLRFMQWRQNWRMDGFSREEMVWITSMVAAGGSFAPAYQWIATIDIDYGQPLDRWQQFMVVLSTQLFGWSLGHMLRHIFVGRRSGIVWPDTLPLSALIQSLYSTQSQDASQFADENGSGDAEPHKPTFTSQDDEKLSQSEFGTATTSKKHLAIITGITFVYQVVISYIAPIFKSLCLLCLWAPRNKLVSLLGSGWNGAGMLSLTFDWEALGTLQPLITPLWAQVQYYTGAFLMMYVLTPIGWHFDWWKTQSQPIVSTNVFDDMGNKYNVSLVHRLRNPDAEVEQYDHYVPGMLMYKTYSPVRLTVNSALGYICSVAAITAVTVHLALWHPQWLRQATSDMGHALLRLWDPRPLFRIRRKPASNQTSPQVHSEDEAQQPASSQTGDKITWNIGYLVGRVGRVLIFTVTIGIAILSPQLGISALPGWQALIAVCWSIVMCLPIGFVEAVTGFTLPMDLLPHMLGGLMQGPGMPIETSYFHLWATVPIRVALGWPGVRSFQLAHHCCSHSRHNSHKLLPWLKRGLFIGIVWGACINHMSYTIYSKSMDEHQVVPVEIPYFEPTNTTELAVDFASSDPADILEEYYDKQSSVEEEEEEEEEEIIDIGSPMLGWHEPGEFGRLPAALSSELVVWGIVGPQSLFSIDSPYRMLFVYGALTGLLLPPLFYLVHVISSQVSQKTYGSTNWPSRIAHKVTAATKAIQVPLVLTGMVAVPSIPANFVISGLAAAVLGQWWFSHRGKSLVDRSLYSVVLYTGTRVSIVFMFVIGQILTARQMSLSFISWWGNQVDNVEHCADI